MPITYPLALPTVSFPSSLHLRAVSVVGASGAPYSGKQTIYAHDGTWWETELNFPPMTRAVAGPWLGWLDSLHGREGSFLMDPGGAHALPMGSAATAPGNPVVNGGGQTGFELSIRTTGLGSVTNYLKAGSFLQLGTTSTTRLHRVGADVNLVANVGTLRLFPRLRFSPTDGATVKLTAPQGQWRLQVNNPGSEEDSAGNVVIDVLPVIEALDF